MSLETVIRDYAELLVSHRDDDEMLLIVQSSIGRVHSVISDMDQVDFEHEVYTLASQIIESVRWCGCWDEHICDKHLEEMLVDMHCEYMTGEGLN